MKLILRFGILLLITMDNATASPYDNFSVNSENPFELAARWIIIVNANPKSKWKAGLNFDRDLPANYVEKLLGTKIYGKPNQHIPVRGPIKEIEEDKIPIFFDARIKWKRCESLQKVFDQGNCGSCWAMTTAGVLTDRSCIASNGELNAEYSTRELLSCCPYCATVVGDGCKGGYPEAAWNFLKLNGIVTGGNHIDDGGCQPYPILPCEHHVEGPRPNCTKEGLTKAPICIKKCTNYKYTKPYEPDHKKVDIVYKLPPNVTEIQKELLLRGPIVAVLKVHDDFFSYKSGIYERVPGSISHGNHAVKIIGWGEENGVPFWLGQNSWNYDWGENGLFKILRGNNECNIEQYMTAGIPHVNH